MHTNTHTHTHVRTHTHTQTHTRTHTCRYPFTTIDNLICTIQQEQQLREVLLGVERPVTAIQVCVFISVFKCACVWVYVEKHERTSELRVWM